MISSGERSRRRCYRRSAVVHRCELLTVGRCLLHMLSLRWNRSEPLLMQDGHFRPRRPHVQPASTAVVADPVIGCVVCDAVVINVVNVSHVHIVYRAVVVERTPVPISALIPMTDVTEAVVDTSVEANVRTPISMVPTIAAATIPPVRRRPQPTHVGSHYPRAGHPIIA